MVEDGSLSQLISEVQATLPYREMGKRIDIDRRLFADYQQTLGDFAVEEMDVKLPQILRVYDSLRKRWIAGDARSHVPVNSADEIVDYLADYLEQMAQQEEERLSDSEVQRDHAQVSIIKSTAEDWRAEADYVRETRDRGAMIEIFQDDLKRIIERLVELERAKPGVEHDAIPLVESRENEKASLAGHALQIFSDLSVLQREGQGEGQE